MAFRRYNFVFASGATSSNKQYVGPHYRIDMVVSAMTGWNSSTGNTSISVRAGLSETDSHADLLSMSISTMSIKSAYNMVRPGTPYLSLGLGSLPTGGGAANIDLIVYSDDL